MIFLTSGSDLLKLITGSAATVDVQATFVDITTSAFTPGRTNTAISTAATTTIIGSPGASTQRQVKIVTVRNKDAAVSTAVTFQHTDGSTAVNLFSCTLLLGEQLQYVDGEGFTVFDSNGNRKVLVNAPGTLIRAPQVITSGSAATYTPPSSCNGILVLAIAQGGGGGGAASTGSNASPAGGGGAGGVVQKYFASPGTGTYTVGTSGGGGGSAGANNGTAGSNTTFLCNSTTITANGGSPGIGASAGTTVVYNAGGAGGAVSTNGDANGAGDPGTWGTRLSGTVAASGRGGSGPYGGGGVGLTAEAAGSNAAGFGAGGGGALSLGTSTRAGGNGAAGLIIIFEYT